MNAALLSFVLVIACDVPETASVSPRFPMSSAAQSSDTRFEHDMMVRFHMRQNFSLLRGIERAIIRGHLDAAKSLAGEIASAPEEPGIPWAFHQTKVRELAAALARSSNTNEACKRSARLAGACGGCHEATSAMVELDIPAIPEDAPTVTARMTRHVWATDRMWEAMIGGGVDAWTRGLAVLAETPLPFRVAQDGRESIARRFQQLASEARDAAKTDTTSDRARRYGAILNVCANCHSSAW